MPRNPLQLDLHEFIDRRASKAYVASALAWEPIGERSPVHEAIKHIGILLGVRDEVFKAQYFTSSVPPMHIILPDRCGSIGVPRWDIFPENHRCL
jgi:hypothetical protein